MAPLPTIPGYELLQPLGGGPLTQVVSARRYADDTRCALKLPRETWPDKGAYDEKARHLAKLFNENFKQFADQANPEVLAAAPKAG